MARGATLGECKALCKATALCRAWAFNAQTGICFLKDRVPPTTWLPHVTSGSMHEWSTAGPSTFQAERRCADAKDPQCGGIAMRGDADGVQASVTSGCAEDVQSLWREFEDEGELTGCEDPTATHGALAVKGRAIPPGGRVTLVITLGWHFPHRVWTGRKGGAPPGGGLPRPPGAPESRTVGNAYTNRLSNAHDSAAEAMDQLNQTLDSIAALHRVLVEAPSWPAYLGDSLANSLSHSRNSQLWKDGTWRQFESFCCNNVDSVHNDYQRHLPYLLFLTETLKDKMRAWAAAQCGQQTLDKCRSYDAGM